MVGQDLMRKFILILDICNEEIEQISYRFSIFDRFKFLDLLIDPDSPASNLHKGNSIDNADYLITNFLDALFFVGLPS